MEKRQKGNISEEKKQIIRDIARMIQEIVPDELPSSCWIEKGQCAYGCHGTLSDASVDWCIDCHRFKYSLENNVLFKEIWRLWEDDIREQAIKEVKKARIINVWGIISKSIEENKDSLGDQMYHALQHFLTVINENLKLDDVEVIFAEFLEEIENLEPRKIPGAESFQEVMPVM